MARKSASMGVRPWTIGCVAAVLVAAAPLSASQARPSAGGPVSSFYELKTTTLDGKPADLSQYRGLVSLVVNVASFCGYTPQYKGLEALHRELRGKGFNVLGFPRSEEHTSELQSRLHLVCRLLLEKKKKIYIHIAYKIYT